MLIEFLIVIAVAIVGGLILGAAVVKSSTFFSMVHNLSITSLTAKNKKSNNRSMKNVWRT